MRVVYLVEATYQNGICTSSNTWLIVLPCYDFSVAKSRAFDTKFNVEMLLNNIKRMIRALNYLHAQHYVHMDVKLDNILETSDIWFLADFDSCVSAGTSIVSYTRNFMPYNFGFDKVGCINAV